MIYGLLRVSEWDTGEFAFDAIERVDYRDWKRYKLPVVKLRDARVKLDLQIYVNGDYTNYQWVQIYLEAKASGSFNSYRLD